MEHDPIPSSICAAVGHGMLSLHVVRCQHTEAVWYRLTVYADQADEIDVLHTDALEFGPFDSDHDIGVGVLNAVNKALTLFLHDRA